MGRTQCGIVMRGGPLRIPFIETRQLGWEYDGSGGRSASMYKFIWLTGSRWGPLPQWTQSPYGNVTRDPSDPIPIRQYDPAQES